MTPSPSTVHRAVTAVSALAVTPSPLQFIADPILAIQTIPGSPCWPRLPE